MQSVAQSVSQPYTIRRSAERGYADHGWLKSYHSFSFAGYHDPAHVNFGPLRVINEDRIQTGTGFGTHSHRDMEIISYVLDGALAHRDSMGTGSVLRRGDVQCMAAGTGVEHSEFNAAPGDTHFLQIWIIPSQPGGAPEYQERHYDDTEKTGRWCLIVSADGAEHSLRVRQDVRIWCRLFAQSDTDRLSMPVGRKTYLHVISGQLDFEGGSLRAGDALMSTSGRSLDLTAGTDSEALLFDLP